MPLGSAVTSTIDIDFTRAQGVNSTGRIIFQPPRVRVQSTMISTAPVVVDVYNGRGSINLVRLPVGTYHVREEIDGRPPYEFDFALPLTAGDILEYETLAETSPIPGKFTAVRTINGLPPDPITGDIEIVGGGGSVNLNALTDVVVSSPSHRQVLAYISNESAWRNFSLALVALTGAYSDLIGKPTIPSTPSEVGAAAASHTHTTSQVTGFDAAVDARLELLIDAAPATLNTLNELAAALGDDPNFAATMTTALAGKAPTVHAHSIAQITGLQDTLDELESGSGGSVVLDATALRYGCKAITLDPVNISHAEPHYLSMFVNWLFQYWVPLAPGQVISKVRLPVQYQAAAGSSVKFAVYNNDNTKLGETADVGTLLQDPGVAGRWVDLPLIAPAASTGPGIWIVGLATGAAGPNVVFVNTASLPGWLLNPPDRKTALYTLSVTALPATLNPSLGTDYIDFCVGVA